MEHYKMLHQVNLHFYVESEKNVHPSVFLHLLWQNQEK